jgi:pyruvate dehydrogenase complex dehydrogenase (E1) component
LIGSAVFEVDRRSIVVAALASLAADGVIARKVVANAVEHYRVDSSTLSPWTV